MSGRTRAAGVFPLPPGPRSLTAAAEEAIVAAGRAGRGAAWIKANLHHGTSTVERVLRAAGLMGAGAPPRPHRGGKPISEESSAAIVQMYANDYSETAIARALGHGGDTVKRVLLAAGVELRPRARTRPEAVSHSVEEWREGRREYLAGLRERNRASARAAMARVRPARPSLPAARPVTAVSGSSIYSSIPPVQAEPIKWWARPCECCGLHRCKLVHYRRA